MGCRKCGATDWLYLGYSFTTFEKSNLRVTGFVCRGCQHFSAKVEKSQPREYIPKPKTKYEAPPKKVEQLTEEEKQVREKQGEAEILVIDDHCKDCGHKEIKHEETNCKSPHCTCKEYKRPKVAMRKIKI